MFITAVAGFGTYGALATWAAVAAAGSHLGAYILIPTVVSMLSSIGISVGGTSAAISAVAALGGPITIVVGLAIGAATIMYALTGGSWQKRLAKKIHELLIQNEAEKELIKGVEKYWSDTKSVFIEGVRQTEQEFQHQLEKLRQLAFATTREEMEERLKYAKEVRDFFAGIPWKPLKT